MNIFYIFQLSAKQNAQKAYKEVLKKEGLTEEAINQVFTKEKRRLSTRSSVNSELSTSIQLPTHKGSPKHSNFNSLSLGLKTRSALASETMSHVGELADLEDCFEANKYSLIS